MAVNLAMSITLLFGCLVSSSEVSICRYGFSSSKSGMLLENAAQNAKIIPATGELQCVMMCSEQTTLCTQLYYDYQNRSCYIFTNLDTVMTTTPSITFNGKAFNTPVISGSTPVPDVSPSCPTGTIAVADCSDLPGGRLCSADIAHCDSEPEVVQVKYYYHPAIPSTPWNGTVQVIYFYKLRSDTALRIQWHAAIGAENITGDLVFQHIVTFNDSDCQNPSVIGTSNSDYDASTWSVMSEADGLCYGLPSGLTKVSIEVRQTGNATGWIYTGHLSGRTTWIWEVLSTPASESCAQLPVFNTRYWTSGNEVRLTSTVTVATISYTKLASDSVLKLTFHVSALVYAVPSSGKCGRWYAAINGSECNPKAEFQLGVYDTWPSNKASSRVQTLEGFCYGLPSGPYSVSLQFGNCNYPMGIPYGTTTCCNFQTTNFIVSEVRMATEIQAVRTKHGRLIKLSNFNLANWPYNIGSLQNALNNGTVLSSFFIKRSSFSGLHLRAAGAVRATQGCCRWYFAINGSECANPGTVEGIYLNNANANYHQTGIVDGVCYGLVSANYTIQFMVGTCGGGQKLGNCYVAHNTVFHVSVEEVQLDAAIECPSVASCS